MMKYNTTLKQLMPSSISEFQNFLYQIKGITLLTYGESDLEVDKHIKFALVNSVLGNNDKYTSSYGLKELRELIAKKENKKHHLNINQENVLITSGSTEALFLTLSSLINQDDEVIICKPFYPLYYQILTYLKAKIVEVNCTSTFEPDFEDFRKKINRKTKAVIFNYPNNPTGSVLKTNTISALSKLFLKYGPKIILDNVYEEIIFQQENSLLDVAELQPQIIVVNSLSKSQRLTGWRLGYLLADKELISLAHKLHQMINICSPKFMMDSMMMALNCDPQIDYYKKNMMFAYDFLNKLGLKTFKPCGGYYIVFNIEKFNMDSLTFCKRLALEYSLGLLPGVFFSLENYVRLSICYDYKTLQYGLHKLKKAINSLSKNNK